ncbi:unnamed protein product [Sympodiomycopsis kandeliae]
MSSAILTQHPVAPPMMPMHGTMPSRDLHDGHPTDRQLFYSHPHPSSIACDMRDGHSLGEVPHYGQPTQLAYPRDARWPHGVYGGPIARDVYPTYPMYHRDNAVLPSRPHLVSSLPAQDSSTVASPILPTYQGLIKTPADAILLLAACDLPRDGLRSDSTESGSMMKPSPPPRRIHRRLLEHERPDLIKPGSVFVWDEKEAGMRRWTDGRCWSASRVSGCFLTYRELELRKRPATDSHGPRANQYKVEGLIKQSFSMTSGSGRKLHIVSYYTKRDIRQGTLRRVTEDPRFVGEAGGEWGLSVDEEEFPDPVASAPDATKVGDASSVVSARDHLSNVDAASVQSGTAPSSPREETATVLSPVRSCKDGVTSSHGDVSSTFAAVNPPALPKRAYSRDGFDGLGIPNLSINLSSRPNIKRKRSSSAGEIHGHEGRMAPRSRSGPLLAQNSTNMLTESNVRGAGLDFLPRKLANPGPHTASTATEQDSAAGALLSLRGSFGGLGSSATPLTTPETYGSGTPLEATGLSKQLSSQGTSKERPKGPDRLPSDSAALSKLQLRL